MDSWHLVSTGILPGRITVVSTQHGKLGGNLSAITPDSLVLLLLECTCFNAKAGIQAVHAKAGISALQHVVYCQ